MTLDTTGLLALQPLCNWQDHNFVVASGLMLPDDPQKAGSWTKVERERRGLSAAELAKRINGLAREAGDPTTVSQQVVSKFEQAKNKKLPPWTRYIAKALDALDGETRDDPHLHMALMDASVGIKLLPTWAGMGVGGTGDDDPGLVSFSRDLIERELRADPATLLAMVAEGNSMEPDFRGGDQILVDTRRKSLAQPGAFCLWDGDGHVIKFLEKVPDSDPPKVRVVALNPLYEPHERLLDEINLVGRVIWFGRRVQ
jgi:phage repressor protein C with HTH and peptisase S24 domain